MAKKKGKQKQHEAAGHASPTAERQDAAGGPLREDEAQGV